MKPIIVLIILFIPFLNFSQTLPGSHIFQKEQLHKLSITTYLVHWEDTLHYYKSYNDTTSKDKLYIIVDILADTFALDSVGMRFKGNVSYDKSQEKNPIKLDFNEFVKGQKLDGLKKVNLNTNFIDPAYMREQLAYDIFEAEGIRCPRSSYVEVLINGEYMGLYNYVDQLDKTYLKSFFGSSKGNLYKNEDVSASLMWEGWDPEPYMNGLEKSTNEKENDWTDIVNLIAIINKIGLDDSAFADSIESHLDIDEFLKILAVDHLIYHWDSYHYGRGKNYFIYKVPSDDRFHWIPWDYNFAWSSRSTDVMFLSSHSYTINQERIPLIRNLLDIERFKLKYFNYLCTLTSDGVFTSSTLDPIIDAYGLLIDNSVFKDDKSYMDYSDFKGALENDIVKFGNRFPGMKSMVQERSQEVRDELEIMGYGCGTLTSSEPVVLNNPTIAWPSVQKINTTIILNSQIDLDKVKIHNSNGLATSYSLDHSGLIIEQPGLYIISATLANGSIQTQKVVILD